MGDYTANRLSDLTDVAHVDISFMSTGALASAGPMMLGYESMIAPTGDPGRRCRFGPGGLQVLSVGYRADGLLWPFEHFTVRSRRYGPFFKINRSDAREPYWAQSPTWGSAGVHVGLLLGVGAEVDAVELFDFLLGFFGCDMVGDDYAPDPMGPDRRRAAEAAAALRREELASE
jgi:hypothetical protein